MLSEDFLLDTRLAVPPATAKAVDAGWIGSRSSHPFPMPLPHAVRAFVPLVIGLAIGGVGVALFMESMPGAEGSPEERARNLEVELQRAQNRIAALENAARGRAGFGDGLPVSAGRDLKDGLRNIAEDLRAGRPVTPDDIFRASKPLLRDLAPLFDRIRVKQQQQMIDGLAGELARKYDLNSEQQLALAKWFEGRAEEEAKRWTFLVTQEHTGIEDLMRASRNIRPDEGIEQFMPTVLSGETLAAFQKVHLAERAERVQQEADTQVQRLDAIVKLDDTQRDQLFAVMARGSKDYDPSMVLEGTSGEIGSTPSGNRQDMMLSLLRPEQRAAYEAERQRRRTEAAKDLEAVGLSLPPDWEMLMDGFDLR